MKQKLNKTILVIVLLATLIIGQPVSAAPQYSIIDLGTLGGNYSVSTAINNRGQVVVFRATASGEYRNFLWQNGTITDLGTLLNPIINDRGQLAGFRETASGEFHTFLWVNGTITDLGTLGGTTSQPYAMNDRGQIVGIIQVNLNCLTGTRAA